jgi:hypothetical protein
VDDGNLKILACNMRRALRAPEECDVPYLLEKGAEELDRLKVENAGFRILLVVAEGEANRLAAAIRKHRDQEKDDRCWLDDIELYCSLKEGPRPHEVDLSLPPECEFLESCRRYWRQRQRPTDMDLEPGEMTIAQLQAEVERLKVGRKEAWGEVQRRADENIKLLDELKVAVGLLCLAAKPPNSSPSSGP